jgi:hypothetical protein
VHAEARERRKPKRPQAPAQAVNPVHSKIDCDLAQGNDAECVKSAMEPGSRHTIGSSSLRSRWSLALALAAGLTLSIALPVQAVTDSVDQSQTVGISYQRLELLAQTFTAGMTGQVDRVSLLTDSSYAFVRLTVQIQSVTTGGAPSGTVLGSTTYAGTLPFKTFTDFVFSSPVPVTAGTQYAILVNRSVGTFNWYNSWQANLYLGGQLYVGCLGCPWYTGGSFGQDFAFKTWVAINTNHAPAVAADNAAVSVNEGTKPTNAGTFSDPDGDTVALTASAGTVTQTGTSSGTWAWTQPAGDEAAAQTVTISANDGKGLTSTTSFPVTVAAVAPNASISSANPGLSAASLSTAAASMSSPEGTRVTLNGSATSPADPDNTAGFTYSWTLTKNGSSFGAGSGSAFSFTPDDEGTFVATLQATDDGTMTGTTSVTITGANVAPSARITSMAPTSGLPLLVLTPNLSLTFAGSFSDAGALDSHTATWNFGDGSTSTTNFGAGGSAGLSSAHSYGAAGNYTVTLTVTDDDGGVGQATTKVAIQTPQAALISISGAIQKLSSLNDGQRNSLTAKVNAATASLNRGDTKTANNQLNALLNELQALVNSGRLSNGDVSALRNSIHAVQAAIGTYNRFLEWWPLGA